MKSRTGCLLVLDSLNFFYHANYFLKINFFEVHFVVIPDNLCLATDLGILPWWWIFLNFYKYSSALFGNAVVNLGII